jgi:hypothetical protein
LKCQICSSRKVTITFLGPHQKGGNLHHLFEKESSPSGQAIRASLPSPPGSQSRPPSDPLLHPCSNLRANPASQTTPTLGPSFLGAAAPGRASRRLT